MVYDLLPSKHRTWQPWANEISNQIADNGRTLSLLNGQQEERIRQRQSARELMETLPDCRQNESERGRLRRFLAGTATSDAMIAKRITATQARLDHWTDQKDHFNTAALKAEQKLAANRGVLRSLPRDVDQINQAKAESGSIAHYGG